MAFLEEGWIAALAFERELKEKRKMIASDTDLVKFHEGCVLTAKPDAKGFWSIGWGHDIAAPQDGVATPTCTQDQADDWLDMDIRLARQRAAVALGRAWDTLDDVRKAMLTDMAYELGGAGLSGFHQMLGAIVSYRYTEAALHGMQSEWAKEVPGRAKMDMDMLSGGEWPQV